MFDDTGVEALLMKAPRALRNSCDPSACRAKPLECRNPGHSISIPSHSFSQWARHKLLDCWMPPLPRRRGDPMIYWTGRQSQPRGP